MKYILLLFLYINILFAVECSYFWDNKTITIKTNDIYGCEYDTRDLKEYNNEIQLLFETNKNQDLELKALIKNQYKVFDVYIYNSPQTDKIKDVIYLKKKNILAILHAYHAIIQETPQEIGVDAIFYKISIYNLLNGFPIKMSINNINTSGIEGFYWGKKKTYKYKDHKEFLNFINNITVINKSFSRSNNSFTHPQI